MAKLTFAQERVLRWLSEPQRERVEETADPLWQMLGWQGATSATAALVRAGLVERRVHPLTQLDLGYAGIFPYQYRLTEAGRERFAKLDCVQSSGYVQSWRRSGREA